MYDEFDIEMLDDSEEFLDSFIENFGDEIIKQESMTTIRNELRFRQLMFAYEVLKRFVDGNNVTVSYKLYEPFKEMGSVSVEGENLEFRNTEWFARAAEFATNTEIYPLNNNRVRVTLTFHNLTVPIE